MKGCFFGAARAAILVAAAAPLHAEVSLESAGWQAAKVERSRVARFSDAASVTIFDERLESRLRGKAVLKNRGPKAAEGLLLRYAVTARLVKAAPTREAAGVWAVPFTIDERRVAKIAPNNVLEVPLSLLPGLELYVKRLARHGFRPDRLRLQVMIEPRDGAELPQMAESLLEVLQL